MKAPPLILLRLFLTFILYITERTVREGLDAMRKVAKGGEKRKL